MSRLTAATRLVLFIALAGVLAACGRSDLQLSGASGSGGGGSGGGPPDTACHDNHDCDKTPATPFCELPPGKCVACLTSPDTCPAPETCDPTTHTCTSPNGCQSDADCSAPKPHCDLDNHTCVVCTDNSQCPQNEVCDNFQCVGFCGSNGTCENGLSCCSPLCVNEQTDPQNCSACGDVCGPYVHGTPGCNGSCLIAACDPGFADCNNVLADGCEVDVNSDPANCGHCGNACANGQKCSGGECVGTCGTTGDCTTGQTCCGGVCANTQTDPDHCGSCQACTTPAEASVTCKAGACAIGNCDAGFGDCNHVESDGCEVNFGTDPKNCGGCNKPCATGETCTGGICVGGCGNGTPCMGGLTCCDASTCANTTNDVNNCGMCDHACANVAHGTPDCASSKCGIGTCDAGFADCNGVATDGCEVNTKTDPDHCGSCTNKCPANSTCVGGVCQGMCGAGCPLGSTCCDTGCVDTKTDEQNCGMCQHACPPGDTCQAGQCQVTCNGGMACGPTQKCCPNGCADTSSDPNACGPMCTVCAMGDTCVNGACKAPATCNGGPACTGSETCCPSGCTDTKTDPQNCGGCLAPCAPGDTCVAGMCVTPTTCNGGPACPTGETCCTSGCVNTQTDTNNCGGCNMPCDPTSGCVDGSCASNEGAFDPIVNPTYLSPGVHNYTSINIPAGVTVYVAGPGDASGTLDLHATGDIVIDGIIDVSGGRGTQNTVASANSNKGTAGGGGFTGEPYQSAAPSSSCEFIAGNPGQLGIAVQGTAGSCFVLSTTVCVSQSDMTSLLFAAPVAQYGGGGGVFSGYRAYGSGGGGRAGGAPGALGAAYPGEDDCSGVSAGGGAVNGKGGLGGGAPYDGKAGKLGQTQCPGIQSNIPAAYVGGGGGGSIGPAAVADLAVLTTFQTGSSGGGGSADYLNRPVFGGTSGGGGGGGALKLSSPTSIVVHGQLLANGGPGGDAYIGIGKNANCDPQPGAAGGGGSGGLIYLSAPTVSVAAGAQVSTAGGSGGEGSEFATGGAGGDGGIGRIRISATQGTCSLGGSFTPSLAAGCNATPGGMKGFAFVGTYPN